VRIPPFKPGATLKAEHLNMMIRVANAVLDLGSDGKTEADVGRNSLSIRLPKCSGMWIKVTAHISGNAYSWTEGLHDGGTTFLDGYEDDASGSDPALESHGLSTVTVPSVAWAWRDRLSGELLFEADACPAEVP
jgi:hypothetical protein